MAILRRHRCWWRMLETKCVGDKSMMMVTDSRCWWPISYIEKITNITKKVANITLSPTLPSPILMLVTDFWDWWHLLIQFLKWSILLTKWSNLSSTPKNCQQYFSLMLVTDARNKMYCWQPRDLSDSWSVSDTRTVKISSRSKLCHQYSIIVTNFRSSISLYP